MIVNWTIHPTDEYPLNDALFAIMPDDGCDGYLVGDMMELIELHAAIARVIADLEAHDGVISHLDERLGWRWLTVTEAAREYGVPADTVRWAVRNGRIKPSRKTDNRWSFPAATFRGWLERKYKGGRSGNS